MAWQFLRFSNGLLSDPDWHGQILGQAGTPPEDELFVIGGATGALVRDSRIDVRIGWVNAAGSMVPGKGAATAELATVDSLPHPTNPTQIIRVISISQELPAVDEAPWLAEPLRVPPQGWGTIRLTAMTPPVGGTRLAVWYWQAPAKR